MLKKFFRWNRRLCDLTGNLFPHARAHLYEAYPKAIASYVVLNPEAVILDVGAGKSCPYAEFLRQNGGGKIIGVDVAADEISLNGDLDEAHVADITKALPFSDNAFDAIVSRSVLEHLENQDAFFREAVRVLKPGGVFIHMLPNKFAPFALVNQLLPNRLSKKLLAFTWEDCKGICGFPAFYDQCYPTALERLFRKHGFVKYIVRVSYYQSFYYAFFFPFYLISMVYEVMVSSIGIRDLGAHMLIYAEKPRLK